MSEHTKEPWEIQPCHEDGALCIIGSNLGGLVGAAHAWPTEIESGDFSRIEANARRIVECVNALAGYNPAALAALIEAVEPFTRIADMDKRKPDGAPTTINVNLCRNLATALANFRNGDTQ